MKQFNHHIPSFKLKPNLSVRKYLYALLIYIAWTVNAVADVAIIVHPNNDVVLSKLDIQRIFLGKVTDRFLRAKVTPYVLDDIALNNEFNRQVLGKTEYQIKSYWAKQMFTGRGKPPKKLKTHYLSDALRKDKKLITYTYLEDAPQDAKVIYIFNTDR